MMNKRMGEEGVGGSHSHGHGQKPIIMDSARSYVRWVKAVFEEEDKWDKYQDFLRLVQDFSDQRIDTLTLKQRAKLLFRGHPHLFLGFNDFIPKSSDDDHIDHINHPQKKHKNNRYSPVTASDYYPPPIWQETINFVNKVNNRFLLQDGVYESFLEILRVHKPIPIPNDDGGGDQINMSGDHETIYHKVKELFRDHQDLVVEFTQFLPQDLRCYDLSKCRSCTPSYRLLPESYPIPRASGRTELDSQVLNDHWVCVSSKSSSTTTTTTASAGSEGGGAQRYIHRNAYEQRLLQIEDDRFELDMLLKAVKSTIKRVKAVKRLMMKTKDDSNVICVEDHLTAVNRRCIERLYGDHGVEVMESLNDNAAMALPVILGRLKQKKEEWEEYRSLFNQVWAQASANNLNCIQPARVL